MSNFYTIVGSDGYVKWSGITQDPNFPIEAGDRLLLDIVPGKTITQKVIRIEPVPTNAKQMVYEVVDDLDMIAQIEKSARKVLPLQFLERFTDEEQLALVTTSLSNPTIRLWYDKILASSEINFDSRQMQLGMIKLVNAGIITQERSLIIFPPYVI
jgi:hypothetical protein